MRKAFSIIFTCFIFAVLAFAPKVEAESYLVQAAENVEEIKGAENPTVPENEEAMPEATSEDMPEKEGGKTKDTVEGASDSNGHSCEDGLSAADKKKIEKIIREQDQSKDRKENIHGGF